MFVLKGPSTKTSSISTCTNIRAQGPVFKLMNRSEGKRLEEIARQWREEHRAGLQPSATWDTASDGKPKIILWVIRPEYQPIMKELQPLVACPEATCRVTTNWEHYYSSSAVMFSAHLMKWQDPPPRRTGQVWILHNHLAPRASWLNESTSTLPHWKEAFNWTMDYRRTADVISPYGILKRRLSKRYTNYSLILSQKQGLASWFVNNCRTESRREEYIAELQRYIQVNIFGSCWGTPCEWNEDEECLRRITNHKFYLAFEDSLCPDYLTDAFFRWYSKNMVLVVRGGAAYKKDLPSGTYINTADFKTIRDLASYLRYLDEHDEQYIQYLKRMEEHESVYETYISKYATGKIESVCYHFENAPLCEICHRLWNEDRYRRTHDNINQWFNQGRCYKPNDIWQW